MMERYGYGVGPTTGLLARGVRLVYWDEGEDGATRRLVVERGGRDVPPPILRVAAPLDAGGERIFVAFGSPTDDTDRIALRDEDGGRLAPTGPPGVEPDAPADATLMVSGLSDTGRVRLVRYLLLTCRGGFSLSADPLYARLMRRVIDEISYDPGQLEPCAMFDRRLFLATGQVPALLGGDLHGISIGGEMVQETVLRPRVPDQRRERSDRYPLYVALGAPALAAEARVVVVGDAGVAVRRFQNKRPPSETLVSWLARNGTAAGTLRDYALDGLTQLGSADAQAAEAAREILLLGDGGTRAPNGVALAAERAVAAGNHVFLSGAMRDPHRLVQRIAVTVGDWTATVPTDALIIHVAGDAERFIALATGSEPAPKGGVARLALRLRSGAEIDAPPARLVETGQGAVAAILDSVPPERVSDAMIEFAIGPALDALGAGPEPADPPPPVVFGQGAADPRASFIVVPSRDPSIAGATLFQLAAWLPGTGVELIWALPDPAQRDAAERALAALDRRFGMASRLVPCPAEGGHAQAAACGAAAAHARRLVFLDGGCLLADQGALTRLLDAGPSGVTGGMVLGFDGSVRHAGFAPPAAGALVRQHEGFPAAALEAEGVEPVFACSSAFLAVDTETFLRLGGFGSGWQTRDWRDVEFCLRAREEGGEVRLATRATAIRYHTVPYGGRGRAEMLDRIDARRFAREWPEAATRYEAGRRAAEGLAAADGPDPRWAA